MAFTLKYELSFNIQCMLHLEQNPFLFVCNVLHLKNETCFQPAHFALSNISFMNFEQWHTTVAVIIQQILC